MSRNVIFILAFFCECMAVADSSLKSELTENARCEAVRDNTVAINIGFYSGTINTRPDLKFFKKISARATTNIHNYSDSEVGAMTKQDFLNSLRLKTQGKSHVNLNIATHGYNNNGEFQFMIPFKSNRCNEAKFQTCLRPYTMGSRLLRPGSSGETGCATCVENLGVTMAEVHDAIGREKKLFGIVDACYAGTLDNNTKNQFFLVSSQENQTAAVRNEGGILSSKLSNILAQSSESATRCSLDVDKDGFVSYQDILFNLPQIGVGKGTPTAKDLKDPLSKRQKFGTEAQWRGTEQVKLFKQLAKVTGNRFDFPDAHCFPLAPNQAADYVEGSKYKKCIEDIKSKPLKCVRHNGLISHIDPRGQRSKTVCRVGSDSGLRLISDSNRRVEKATQSFHLVYVDDPRCPTHYGYIDADDIEDCKTPPVDQWKKITPTPIGQ